MLVNNAGIGVVGAFEATPMAHVREVFETNTFGVMAMCQAVIPQFRARRSGTIVNVTSSVTLAPMPLAAAYTASKPAIEGFTGSLAHELGAFGVRVKLVEPGYAPDDPLPREYRRGGRRPYSRRLCGLRAADLRRVRAAGADDDGTGRGRGGVAGGKRRLGPAALSAGPDAVALAAVA